MATKLQQTFLVLVASPAFDEGMQGGASWYFHRDSPAVPSGRGRDFFSAGSPPNSFPFPPGQKEYRGSASVETRTRDMLIYEYKLDGNQHQYQAIDEAIRIVQFIRNQCLRKWVDGRGVSQNDLQCHCAALASEYLFAARLNSQARQASADRAWAAISRFYKNCKEKKPGKIRRDVV